MESNETQIQLKPIIKDFQRNELTEYLIYLNLAKSEKSESNKKILEQIAVEEKLHYDFWKSYTNEDIRPNKWKIIYYVWLARILGITFGIKLMEKGEARAQYNYATVLANIPEAQKLINEEDAHEQKLIALIEEERLNYVGSIVLGLNDALVELTGALAGLSFGLQNTKLIAFAGLITGIAAGFSMAAAEFLSQRHEGAAHPFKSAFYTGIAYFITVGFLIIPYLVFTSYMMCLSITMAIAILIILFFNYYISVAKDLPFKRRFLEMAFISIGVSAITFGISVLIKKYFGIQF
jgi:VIT1/CCC1 family predicted Fe2+/Mn2+ transporter